MRYWTVLALLGCGLDQSPPAKLIHARFDPDAKKIPMPTDVLRDSQAGKLNLPIDDTLTDAEKEFFGFLNTLDGWSSTMTANVEFTGKINPETINFQTLQVWDVAGPVPQRVQGATVTLEPNGTKLNIDAPRTGWARGGRYAIVLVGGKDGVKGAAGEPVECDAAFYFLRLTEELDTPQHERAFPGDTHAERMSNAKKLEDIRKNLAPMFQFIETQGLKRTDIAALWQFTVTARVEVAMDKASQRMPIPFDLLLDPATGKVDLPAASWDSAAVVEAKQRLREYDGFSTSANLTIDLTGQIDPSTATAAAIRLYEAGSPPRQIDADFKVLDDKMHIVISPHEHPLKEATRYAVVVADSVKDLSGAPVIAMPPGFFMRAHAKIADDAGKSRIGAVEDEDAARVEFVRQRIYPTLDQVGRDHVVTAWPFTTMTIRPGLDAAMSAAQNARASADPKNASKMTTSQAINDFPIGIVSLFRVKEVWNGTIESPDYLDAVTHGFRKDAGYSVEDVAFTMTIPNTAQPGQPLPVVVFGHGLMTERRFVLAIADALAQNGFAAISIDLPYHGTRTACVWSGPLCYSDPLSNDGHEICPQPCESGSTCQADGRCVDANGQGNHLAKFPVIPFPQASGAAFIDVPHVANTKDHFWQSLVDISALTRSLRTGNWQSAIGYPIDTNRIYYAGQSLGGIIGGTYVPLDPKLKRAVLNVPGCQTVDMFTDSPTFGGHVTDFLKSEMIAPGSADQERFMDVARWFMDATDPMNVAPLMQQGRSVMIQMATLDNIIPNKYTQELAALTGVPKRDYVAEHAFIVVPIEPEYGRGLSELSGFLAGSFAP
jgi:dienelactone hydrolase